MFKTFLCKIKTLLYQPALRDSTRPMRSPIATAYDYASLPEWMSPRRCVLLEVNGDVAGTKTKAPVAASSAKQTTPTKSSTTTTKARNAKTESIANTTMHAEMTDYEREREVRSRCTFDLSMR